MVNFVLFDVLSHKVLKLKATNKTVLYLIG
jgi:hypothetical protein